MKAFPFLKVLFVCLLAIFFASCRSSRTTRAPYPTGRSYPHDRRYPQSRSVYRMPPGQAKKVYGHQSARAFAPGQQKKHYSNSYQYKRGHHYKKSHKHRGHKHQGGKKGKK